MAEAVKAVVLADQVAIPPSPPLALAPHAGYRWQVTGSGVEWHAEEVPEEQEQSHD